MTMEPPSARRPAPMKFVKRVEAAMFAPHFDPNFAWSNFDPFYVHAFRLSDVREEVTFDPVTWYKNNQSDSETVVIDSFVYLPLALGDSLVDIGRLQIDPSTIPT